MRRNESGPQAIPPRGDHRTDSPTAQQASCKGQDPDPDEVAQLRQLFKAQRAEKYLTEVVTEKPALSAGQLEHLTSVLLTAARSGDDAA